MSALDAALETRSKLLSEEKAAKQARCRLVADSSISVTSIEKVLNGYLHYKKTKNLWSVICPGPAGPSSYSWHTTPQAEWLAKTANLLFDMVGLAANTARSFWQP